MTHKNGKYDKKKSKTNGVLIIFHPGVIALTVMLGLISLQIFKIAQTEARYRVQNKNLSTKSGNKEPLLNHNWITHSSNLTASEQTHNHHRRIKRFTNQPIIDTKNRPIPETVLDDMLLDAEMPLEASQCLKKKTVIVLEETETNLRLSGITLNEHLEPCTSTDDCLQISPYIWKVEGTGEPCRKSTHLRCNMTENKCVCQDKLDMRWETEIEQSAFQWNPITKTCYVRGTMPCKLGIPCSPGMVCRSSVSFTYNTPPIQRICECNDINLSIGGDSRDWWYCKKYWKRTWVYDVDNINKWHDPPPHIFRRFSDKHY